MKIPFGDFTPMHSEIRQEMLTTFEDVYDKGWFIGGEPCERFEEHFAAYVGTRHCVACGNGLDGLHMMLVAAGIGPGDEVIGADLYRNGAGRDLRGSYPCICGH